MWGKVALWKPIIGFKLYTPPWDVQETGSSLAHSCNFFALPQSQSVSLQQETSEQLLLRAEQKNI